MCNVHLHDGMKAGHGHLALNNPDLRLGPLLDALENCSGFVSLETLGWADTATSWSLWSRYLAEGRPAATRNPSPRSRELLEPSLPGHVVSQSEQRWLPDRHVPYGPFGESIRHFNLEH